MMKPARFIRYYFLRFLRLKGDPRQISRGVALGTFVGITPTIPLHTIALLIFTPLLRANIVASFLASFLTCNPLTYLPQYYFSWMIGNWLTPNDLSWDRIKTVMDAVFSDASFTERLNSLTLLGMDTIIVLVVGGFILATPFTLASYFVSLRFFTGLQAKRREKHVLN